MIENKRPMKGWPRVTRHDSPKGMTTNITSNSSQKQSRDELRVLIIGDPPEASQNRLLRPSQKRTFRRFEGLDVDDIIDLGADVVISALFANRFDCLEVAALLSAAGFQGRYRAFSTPLPRPELVKNEVSAAFPSLDFDIIFLGVETPKSA